MMAGWYETLFPVLEELNIGYVAFSPLANGYKMAEEKNADPAQISLAWILCKKPYLVPIPGSRKTERMRENANAADIILTAGEVTALDEALNTMEMSDVFGGSKIKRS